MKKHLFYISSALLGLLSVNSCMSELEKDVDRAGQVPDNRVHLTVQAGTPEMKTYIEGTSPKWNNGDNLGVFFDSWSAGATAVGATLTNSAADAEKAVFEGDVTVNEGNHTVYAFYPARAFYATEAESIVNMEIPYIQFPTATSFDPKADLLVGVPKEVEISGTSAAIENMQFRRVGAIIKVCLVDATTGTVLSSEKVKSVKIESSDFDLAGAFRYDFANEDAAATQILAASAKKSVTADFTESPVAFDTDIYLIANPVTLTSGSTLTFTVLTDGHEVVKVVNLPSNVELKSSKIATFTLTLNNTCTLTRVYFQDNFDWVYKYWDAVYGNAYTKSQVGLDPVAAGSNDAQPNIWSTYASSFGNAFTSIGYIDLEHEAGESRNVLYAQENYLKMCKKDNQTGIELPILNLGDYPVNVTLAFDIALNDKKNFVVEVLGRGTCADSGTSVSNTFTDSETFSWKTRQFTLLGLTNSSRICIRPAVDKFSTSGYYRFFIDNIKVTEAAPTPAAFPVVWNFPAPSSTWVAATDYELIDKSFSGSYVYSDDHQGKIIVTSTANGAGGSDPTYRLPKDDETWCPQDEYFILHYCMGLNSYWEFDIPNVKNDAGTYTISYKMAASNAGPKHFRLEYTFDDNWDNPVPIEANLSVPDNKDSSTMVKCTYSLDGNNTIEDVNASFHVDAMDAFKTLNIRALVVSKQRCNGDADLAKNSGGTNRLLGNPTISFTPDSPAGVSYYHGGTYGD